VGVARALGLEMGRHAVSVARSCMVEEGINYRPPRPACEDANDLQDNYYAAGP